MFSRQEVQQRKQQFWTAFGLYMKPVPGAGDSHPHWINYKTGVTDVLFHMDALQNSVRIALEFRHARAERRTLFLSHFEAQKSFFESMAGTGWITIPEYEQEGGKKITAIFQQQEQLHIHNPEHWPAIISFFKPRIIALDRWWSYTRDSFSLLSYSETTE